MIFTYLTNIIYYNYKFIYILYFLCKNDLTLLEDSTMKILKKEVFNAGPISIKFMQWYMSNCDKKI